MIIISGPSTIGKNPIIEYICKNFDYDFITPWTTRCIRNEELQGKDYFFVNKDIFKQKILDNSMIEWDYCLDNYYGYSNFDTVSPNQITHGLSRMATRMKIRNPDFITTIFLFPENKDEIINVLKKIYKDKDLMLRLALVEEELNHSSLFDYLFTIKKSVYELLDNDMFLQILNKNI